MKIRLSYLILAAALFAACGSEAPKATDETTETSALFNEFPELKQAEDVASFGAEGFTQKYFTDNAGIESVFLYSATTGMLERAKISDSEGVVYEYLFNGDGGAFLCYVISQDTLAVVLRDERASAFVKNGALHEVEDAESWAEKLLSFRMDLLVNEFESTEKQN
jgi:outer membrane biogenesis lipoprotein LolB